MSDKDVPYDISATLLLSGQPCIVAYDTWTGYCNRLSGVLSFCLRETWEQDTM